MHAQDERHVGRVIVTVGTVGDAEKHGSERRVGITWFRQLSSSAVARSDWMNRAENHQPCEQVSHTKSPARAGLKSRRNVGSSEPTAPSLQRRVSELGQCRLCRQPYRRRKRDRTKIAASSASVRGDDGEGRWLPPCNSCKQSGAIAVPIRRLLENHAFGPDEIRVLTTAFEDTLRTLRLTDRADPATEIIARKIIELALQGERDPNRLRERASQSLSQ